MMNYDAGVICLMVWITAGTCHTSSHIDGQKPSFKAI